MNMLLHAGGHAAICLAVLAGGLMIQTTSSCEPLNSSDRLVLRDSEIRLQTPRKIGLNFVRAADGKWSCAQITAWNGESRKMVPAFTFEKGEFLQVPGASPALADGYERLQQGSAVGARFHGASDVSGARINWESAITTDTADPLPLVHLHVRYSVDKPVDLPESPRIAFRTTAVGAESAVISNIMGYLRSDPGGTIRLEQGYPAVWLHSSISGGNYNCLAIVDTDDKDANGALVKKSFSVGRTPEGDGSATAWSVGNSSEPGKTVRLEPGREYSIGVDLFCSVGEDWLGFYRSSWSGLIDYLCPPDKTPFVAKNWDECAKGLVEDYKDKDHELYIPGKGYIIGAGGKHTHWYVAPTAIHGILYYTWATGDRSGFDFFKKRMMECDLNQWWRGPSEDDGINWGWDPGGFAPRGNIWQMLDIGMYPVYNIYKLTGDEYYLRFFKRFMDYTMDHLIENNAIGQEWDAKEKRWYYTDYSEATPKSKPSLSASDHRDFPGALAVYTYLCLLDFNETGDTRYRDRAYAFIDHINSFLADPGRLWTIEEYTKTNGFAFAMMSNIKRYELTKETKYLDYAEQWAYTLLTMYHQKSEGHGDLALAHAGGQGLGEFFCVATLETVEPAYLVANLLKYRVDPAFLKFMALTDRTHLIVYPRNHPNYANVKHIGRAGDMQWTKYQYIPLELIPYESDPAMYMGGAPMVQNMVLHGLHECSDPEITAICTDAAETGLNLRQSRNLVVYNPTKTDRAFTLFIKGMNGGSYTLSIDGRSKRTLSAEELAKGVEMKLKASKWSRVVVTEAKGK